MILIVMAFTQEKYLFTITIGLQSPIPRKK